jgi:hypothetical protein
VSVCLISNSKTHRLQACIRLFVSQILSHIDSSGHIADAGSAI